ncbi:hypothetical protein D0T23_02255 [Duganella sp. BJB475]|nr:hypothetical protein D0T23_02255 [Duganella sp. BJB475]RFP35303.1 hypothetical protein D0T21_02255 [Duganella sp. BJB476]
MSSERLIRTLNCDLPRFKSSFQRLKPDIKKEARRALGEMVLMDIDAPPAKLHLHMLTNKQVTSVLDPTKKVNVYTVHLTSNDAYKASFTFEGGCAYLRDCGTHADIDKSP